MKCRPLQLWTLTLVVSAACGHGGGVQHPEPPRPGVPDQELALLVGEYSFNESKCFRTAAEVVDMQRRCNETRWADCMYAGQMYSDGCGVAEDRRQAEALYRRACDFGSVVGCGAAGSAMNDLEQSIALLELACAKSYSFACNSLGIKLFRRDRQADVERAAQLLDKACCEDQRFCSYLGDIVSKRKLEPRFEATQKLLAQACEKRDVLSCHVLAKTLEDGTLGTFDYERAATVNTNTCHELSYVPSCHSLGHMLMLGRGRQQNQTEGAWYFYESCNRGYGESCDSMGEAVENGWGGPADPAKALAYYARGCELHLERACQNAKKLRAAGVVLAPASDRTE